MTAPVLLTHASPVSASTRAELDLRMLARSAQQAGWRVWTLPLSFDSASAADVLDALPVKRGTPALFSGYWAGPEFYRELHAAATARELRLLNTPEQSERLMRFDGWYPRIEPLTARSMIIRSPSDCRAAAQQLGLPLFIKGLVKSQKEAGWDTCVAQDAHAVDQRFKAAGHGGTLVARQLLDLRRAKRPLSVFPVFREYRVLLLGRQVLGHGFYWDGADPFGSPTRAECEQMRALALSAARLIGAPLQAVDVGQLQDRSWKVIEVGDPQYSGIVHLPHPLLLQRLSEFTG